MSATGVDVSRDLLWILTKGNNAHCFRRRGIKHTLTSEPLNPKGIETFRNSGNIHEKAITVEANPGGKGVTLIYRKKKVPVNKPAKHLDRVPLNRGFRKTVSCIRKFCNRKHYRRDLKTVVLRKACAILKSQKQAQQPGSSSSSAPASKAAPKKK